ncbi:uncharacterized protein A4U43_C08F23230 [Asparagus officinalis]|nr:uncharacterized protein A4U43_C08F23230 [Asparagus officinalis]
MVAALSSSFLAYPTSTKISRTLLSQFYSPLPLPSSVPLSSSQSISRKIYKVRAASLKENDEEVIAEDSFRARTPLDNERKEMDAEQSEPVAVERWVINFEQSVNVFLIKVICLGMSYLIAFVFPMTIKPR